MAQALLELDGGILLWIQSFLRSDLLNAVVGFYTRLGDGGLIWIALSVCLLLHPKTRRAGICALCAMLLGFLCTNVALKHLFARPRPWLSVEGLSYVVYEKDPNSFPSGHACAAFAAAVAWWRTLPWKRGRILAVGMAVLMALSRLYVGVHFPSDVLAGALVGALCGRCAWWLLDLAEEKYRQSGKKC